MSQRNTSSFGKHLAQKHQVTQESQPPTSMTGESSSSLKRQRDDPCPVNYAEEEEPPFDEAAVRPQRKQKQARLDGFLVAKHTLRSDALRFVCESNVSLNEVVSSKAMRRVLSRSYPGDPPLPQSATTLSKWLHEDASKLRDMLQLKLSQIRAEGETS